MKNKAAPRGEGDFFPMRAAAVLAALHGKTIEEEAQSLLDQEEDMRKTQKEVRGGQNTLKNNTD